MWFLRRDMYVFGSCVLFFLSHIMMRGDGAATQQQQRKPPHIIFILADDLGWNDISLHGSPQIPTPNIDRLAHQGVILDKYYVMHLCSPTRGSLLTGRHAMQLGLQDFVITETAPFGLGLNETILPQYLKPYGYSSHMVGKWHQGFFAKELTPLYRGFDSFYGFLTSHESYYEHKCECVAGTVGGPKVGYDFRDGVNLDWAANGSYSTYLYTKRAQNIIQEQDPNEPMFLYFAHQAVHTGLGAPHDTPEHAQIEAPQEIIDKFSYIEDLGRRKFAAMTYLLDESIGNVTRTLQERGMLENSVIIFSTDNGGPPKETTNNAANNWPLRGSKGTFWEGGVRGDGFVWSKLIKKPGRISTELMHVTDWLPTILHLANGSSVSVQNLYGQDMWPTISNAEPSPRKSVVINFVNTNGAIIRGKYKLQVFGRDVSSKWYEPPSLNVSTVNFTVKCPERDNSLPPCHKATSPCLFDLSTDPCEYNNIAHKFPEVVKQLSAELAEFAGQAQPPRNCPNYKWADPMYHGGAWVPYIHLNDTKHDRMC